ncbi:MAG: toll/interleukin-1 receptor domain-containing protein [Hyphomonadaceae bacterium]|nr:toll/interleukin-1 receptor domain-containing protein [Hyphomonadaceae bacterium]
MSNGYVVVAAADVETGREIADGFGLDLITVDAVGDVDAAATALANAANVGILLTEAAAADPRFVALMQALPQKLGAAQLIVSSAEVRATFSYLPAQWPAMNLDEARARVAEITRRRQAEAPAPAEAQPAPPAPPESQPAPPEPAPAEHQAEPAPVGAEPHEEAPPQQEPETETPRAPEPPAEEHAQEDLSAAESVDEPAAAEEPAAPPAQDQAVTDAPAPDDSFFAKRDGGDGGAAASEQAPSEDTLDIPSALQRQSEAATAAPPSEPPHAEPPPAAPAPAAPVPMPAPMPAPPASAPAPAAPPQAPAKRSAETARMDGAAATTAPADATAFAPKKLRRGTPELVRLVVHQPKDLAAVIKAAKKIDPRTDAAPQGMRIGDVALGASIGVALDVRGATCDGALQRRTWTGEPIDFNFSVEAEDGAKQAVFLARVFVDDAQIGVVAFTRKISGPAKKPASEERVRLKRHKRVFLSYSSHDRETVAVIATAYERAGVPHFWDRTSLKSGEQWHPRLRTEIDRADLFHLCWSKAASASEWVEKEAQYALTKNKRSKGKTPEITVQMLDGPPWAKHPASLDEINFDDFVRAAIVGYARGDGES